MAVVGVAEDVEGPAVGGAEDFWARPRSRLPEAPVRRRVVPTDMRKMRLYFLDGSIAESVWKGPTGAGAAGVVLSCAVLIVSSSGDKSRPRSRCP